MEVFPLPLPDICPFPYPNPEAISTTSRTSAFDTSIKSRDLFNGSPACVFCGWPRSLELTHAHIVPKIENDTWTELQAKRWVPSQVKDVEKEPRNGILLCPNCHVAFDKLAFFIRYVSEAQKFVFINFSNHPNYRHLRQKAIGLQPRDSHAVIPALFLIHECRVRGFNPFCQNPPISENIEYADWIPRDGDNIQRQRLPESDTKDKSMQRNEPENLGAGTGMSTGRVGSMIELTWDQNIIQKILYAQRDLPTWKECIVEGTTWEGSAEENVVKYKKIMDL